MPRLVRRRRKDIVLSSLANAIPLGDIAQRIDKFVDGGDDEQADGEGVDDEAKASPVLPVVLPGEVDKLAEDRVRVLHSPPGSTHCALAHLSRSQVSDLQIPINYRK